MVLTYFWADNFNQNLESQTGHGVIDSTHIVQFAENSESTKSINLISSMERSKRRSIQHKNVILPAIHVDKKRGPDCIISGEKASVIYPDVQKIFRSLSSLDIFKNCFIK